MRCEVKLNVCELAGFGLNSRPYSLPAALQRHLDSLLSKTSFEILCGDGTMPT